MRKKLLVLVVASLFLIVGAVGIYLWNYPEVSGGLLIGCAAGALVGSFALLWFGPKLQLASLSGITDPKSKFDVENEARKSLATILAASFFLFSGYAAWSNLESSLNKDRTAQLTKSLEMLENSSVSIRVAGANYLALLTRQFNSKGDYMQAIRAMNDVVQSHTTMLGKKSPLDNSCGPYPASPTEIQRLLRFLGNRRYPSTSSDDRLTLDDVDLRGAYMGSASENQSAGLWAWARSRRMANTYAGEWAYASFYGSNLSAVNLANANLEHAQFAPSLYTGEPAKLSAACVQYSADQKPYPAPTTLAHADLQSANFFGAQMQGAYLTQVDAHKATLPNANLTGADVTRAQLQQTSFNGAQLQQARFDESDLTCADMRNAIFSDTVLAGAHLQCANLQGAKLDGEDLSQIDMSKTLCITPQQLASAKQQPDKKPDFQNCPANWRSDKCDVSTPNCTSENGK